MMYFLSFISDPFWFWMTLLFTIKFLIIPMFQLILGFCVSHFRRFQYYREFGKGNGMIKKQSNSGKIGGDKRSENRGLDAILPKLGSSDYYTDPKIEQLAAKEREKPGYCGHVKGFVVGRHGYGSVKFLGKIDVRGLHLESVIKFSDGLVTIYTHDGGKPVFGHDLKNHAVVINSNSKTTGNQIKLRFEKLRRLDENAENQVADRSPTVSKPEGLREFTYQSLVDATQNFLLDCRVSFDKLGDVFRGQIHNTNEVVAIRRVKYSGSSLKEFLDEVLFLSQANHPNLAKLIGYCVEKYHRILVYEHFPRGTLENQLYGLYTCFDFDMRIEIALGVARALEYLHNSMTPPILHCYIQPANIWLDDEYTPKLSAYGLVGTLSYSFKKIGSYEYTLPDYSLTKNVTIESDIYGFGIFLLELITGKRGIFVCKDGSEYLIEWAQPYLKEKRTLVEMVDRRLEGEFDNEQLVEVCDIIKKCLQKQPTSRLLIADIVTRLDKLANH